MADTPSSTDGGQASTSGTGQAPATTIDGQAPVSQTQPDERDRIIAELRKENAAARKLKADIEQQQKEAELAKLGETEKLQKQLTDTQAQLGEKERANQERVIRYEVQLQAAALGVDPLYLDKIARLIDRNEIKTDDEGMPTNVKELLDKLVKEMPALVLQQQATRPSTAGGATNPGRTTASTTGLSWEVITKMTREQYNAREQEIMQWMKKNPPKRF